MKEEIPINKPLVLINDHDKDLAALLMDGLRQMHGQRVEVFTLDHAQLGETVMVLLPENGPSLAAALRDWVDAWWSEGDEATYGTPEAYLRGFGVVIEPGEYTSFSTSCPYCGQADELEMVGGTFQTLGVPITAAGFALADASMMQTEDEIVLCNACQRSFSADAILL